MKYESMKDPTQNGEITGWKMDSWVQLPYMIYIYVRAHPLCIICTRILCIFSLTYNWLHQIIIIICWLFFISHSSPLKLALTSPFLRLPFSLLLVLSLSITPSCNQSFMTSVSSSAIFSFFINIDDEQYACFMQQNEWFYVLFIYNLVFFLRCHQHDCD